MIRATPIQARQLVTYERILSGATEVLDVQGWEEFNTNAVAAHFDFSIATVNRHLLEKLAFALTAAEWVFER